MKRFLKLLQALVGGILLVLGPVHAADEGSVNFSFDQVDVRSFVKLVGEMTGRQFVVADGVQGKITVVAPRVARAEVYPLFLSILETVGCSVVEEKGVGRVVALNPRTAPVAPVFGPDEPIPATGVITKIFRLRVVPVGEIRKVLEAQMGAGRLGAVGAIEDTNHLIVTDTAEGVRRVERILSEIDKPGLARKTEVVALQYARAEDLAQQINRALLDGESRGDALKSRLPAAPGASSSDARQAVVVAAPHSSSLIIVGTETQVSQIKELVSKMDIDAPAGRGRLNAIFLKYMDAEEGAKSISALLAKSGGKEGEAKPIAIEPSVANNALLVDASPGDFEVVRSLVQQLDAVPEQVHIEVMIAEVASVQAVNWSVKLAVLDAPSEVGDTVLRGSSTLGSGSEDLMDAVEKGIFPNGISLGVAHGYARDSSGNLKVSYPGILNVDALKRDGRLNIVSQTSLEAQNNREASVSIVNEIPVLKSTIEGGSGSSRDVIQNIERVDVGIKLKLTPHVIPGGEVQMELNPSIEAVVDSGPTGTQFAPTIAKRQVQTTVTVPDRDTIVIAGLTRRDRSRQDQRVPYLGSIPVLGNLFRSKADADESTDLLIFVTPQIVRGRMDSADVMSRWEGRTGVSTNGHK